MVFQKHVRYVLNSVILYRLTVFGEQKVSLKEIAEKIDSPSSFLRQKFCSFYQKQALLIGERCSWWF